MQRIEIHLFLYCPHTPNHNMLYANTLNVGNLTLCLSFFNCFQVNMLKFLPPIHLYVLWMKCKLYISSFSCSLISHNNYYSCMNFQCKSSFWYISILTRLTMVTSYIASYPVRFQHFICCHGYYRYHIHHWNTFEDPVINIWKKSPPEKLH